VRPEQRQQHKRAKMRMKSRTRKNMAMISKHSG
jgi:hypothetical protein